MPHRAPAQRLSPKVRHLLQEHGLQARSVPGTGAHGRVTPHDVLGAAGVPRTRGSSGVLASPLARRVLREAGVDLASAVRANDGARLTRADAELVISELAGGTDTTARGGRARPGQARTVTSEVEVDVALLLAGVAAASPQFRAHNGFDLSPDVALACAAAAVLVRRPDLEVAAALPPSEDGSAYPPVHVGFPRPRAQGGGVAVVRDAQHLTVGGLARRARAAVRGADDTATATGLVPTVVVATDADAPDTPTGDTAIGLLTLSNPTPRHVASVDDLGNEVVRTRPHARVLLHHDDRTTSAAAEGFLEELSTTVRSWALPLGP